MDTIKIIIDTNAEDAAKSFDDLSNSFKKTDNEAVDLRKQIRELKADLFKLTPGTVEYAKKIQELGAKMDELGDTQERLKVATGGLDTVFQITTRTISSLAGGFSAAMGIVTLFGKDSESLMKTMVQLQAALNITRGLNEFAAFPKMLDKMAISIEAYADTLGASAATASAEAVALGADTASTTANAAAKAAATSTTISNSAAVVQNTETVTTNTLASSANAEAVKMVAVARTVLNAALEKGMISELQYSAALEKSTADIYAQAAAGVALNEQRVKMHALNIAGLADTQAFAIIKQTEVAAQQAETVATKAETVASAENTAAKEVNTAASNANANAHIKNAAALEKEAIAEKEAAAGSVTLASSFKRFGKAAVSLVTTPIGMIILALAGLTTAFVTAGKKQREAIELNKEYADAIAQLPPPIENAEQALQKYMNALDEYDKKLQAIGISEERRSEVRMEAMEKQRDRYEQELKNIQLEVKTLENQIDEYYQTIDDGGNLLSDEADVAVAMASAGTEKWSRELKALKERAKETNEALQQVNEELRQLASQQLPDSVRALNQALSDLNDQFRISIAGGSATNGDQIKAQIQLYKDAYNDLFKIAGGMYRIKGDTQDEQRINQELATKYQNEIKKLEVDLAVYNAGLAKKASDSTKQAAKTLNSNFEKLVKDIDVKVADYVSAWEKAFNRFAEIGKYADSDMILPEQSLGRALTELNRYGMDVTEYITEWKNNAKNALDAGEISQSLYDKLLKKIASAEESMRNSIAALNKSGISDAIFNQGKNIQGLAEEFRKQNETLLDALSGGLVTPEEYENYLESRLTEYRAKVGPEIEKALSMINEEVANAAPENQEQLRKILESYINLTGEVLPPEVMQNINSVISESIDKRFDEIESKLEARRDKLELLMDSLNSSWLEGRISSDKSYKDKGIFFDHYFGSSPTETFREMQQQTDALYNILNEEYNKELELLRSKQSLFDVNSEEYKKYGKTIERIENDLIQAEVNHQAQSLSNMRQYGENIKNMTMDFSDAVGGLAAAMSGYYAEQAEHAKAMYGENSEEYKKYLKKEGNMKIAQVWTDFATGVMTAWSTSEQLGPIAGPIMAAIQTASLLATAVASTQQIKRQTQATASGSTNANVSGITDRVVFGAEQNANQRAELNAQYNQGATRVFVVATDMSEKQGENRTAAISNTF